MRNSKLCKIANLWSLLLLLHITIVKCHVILTDNLVKNNNNSSSDGDSDFILQSLSLQRVESPPHFSEPTALPTNLTMSIGDILKINCTAAINVQPTPNITWTLNGEPIERNVSYDKWALLIWDVQSTDEGNYVCRLCNRLGCIEHSTKLIVPEEDSSIDGDYEDDVVEETTVAGAGVRALTTTTKSTKTIDVGTTEVKHNEHSIDGGGIGGGNVETVNSDHDSPPTFKKTDKFLLAIRKPAGVSITLSCPANGSPMPTIKWKVNDTDIMRRFGDVTIKKWSMQMDETIAEDSGQYKCIVCNYLGCIEHTTNVIIVDRLRARPIMSDKYPQNRTVLVNSTADMECRFTSDLEPFIRWIKFIDVNISAEDTEKLVPILGNNGHTDNDSKPYEVLSQFDNTQIINLTNLTHADEGWYTCIAATTLGQAWARAYLHVVDNLPVPKDHTVVDSVSIWYIGIPVVIILFSLVAACILYMYQRLRKERLLKHRIEMVHQWTKKVIIYRPDGSEGSVCELQIPVIKIEKQRTTFQTSGNMMDPTQPFNEYEFPLDANWEIPRTQLTLGSTLGEGAFGRVVRAEACGLQTSGQSTIATSATSNTIVAVKMVKEEHTDADMASLVREMEVMKMIGKHINIINLLGCCSQNGPLWVIVEFAPHGNLKDFLKRNRPMCAGGPTLLSDSSYLSEERPCSGEKPTPLVELTEKKLISFAFQIARGMEYLASRRCIHRDLAARNVLVSDDYVLKIADFGLARDIQDTDYYRKNTNGRLPIKWMAPESLQEKFYDSQSDVWSYGVLLWEIMTYGEQPYPNVICAEELYSYLITGQRMEKPLRCSLNIYMLMRQCWHFDGSARPTFTELVENLEKILQLANSMANEDYLDLSMPMLETPPSSSDEDNGEDDDNDGGEFDDDDNDETDNINYKADFDVIDGYGRGVRTARYAARTAATGRGDSESLLTPQRYQYTYKFN